MRLPTKKKFLRAESCLLTVQFACDIYCFSIVFKFKIYK